LAHIDARLHNRGDYSRLSGVIRWFRIWFWYGTRVPEPPPPVVPQQQAQQPAALRPETPANEIDAPVSAANLSILQASRGLSPQREAPRQQPPQLQPSEEGPQQESPQQGAPQEEASQPEGSQPGAPQAEGSRGSVKRRPGVDQSIEDEEELPDAGALDPDTSLSSLPDYESDDQGEENPAGAASAHDDSLDSLPDYESEPENLPSSRPSPGNPPSRHPGRDDDQDDYPELLRQAQEARDRYRDQRNLAHLDAESQRAALIISRGRQRHELRDLEYERDLYQNRARRLERDIADAIENIRTTRERLTREPDESPFVDIAAEADRLQHDLNHSVVDVLTMVRAMREGLENREDRRNLGSIPVEMRRLQDVIEGNMRYRDLGVLHYRCYDNAWNALGREFVAQREKIGELQRQLNARASRAGIAAQVRLNLQEPGDGPHDDVGRLRAQIDAAAIELEGVRTAHEATRGEIREALSAINATVFTVDPTNPFDPVLAQHQELDAGVAALIDDREQIRRTALEHINRALRTANDDDNTFQVDTPERPHRDLDEAIEYLIRQRNQTQHGAFCQQNDLINAARVMANQTISRANRPRDVYSVGVPAQEARNIAQAILNLASQRNEAQRAAFHLQNELDEYNEHRRRAAAGEEPNNNDQNQLRNTRNMINHAVQTANVANTYHVRIPCASEQNLIQSALSLITQRGLAQQAAFRLQNELAECNEHRRRAAAGEERYVHS
jgi:hypothetical protein